MCASPPGGGSAAPFKPPYRTMPPTRLAKISIHSRSDHRARLSLCVDARRRFASATIDIPLVGGEAAKAAAAPVLKVFYWPKMMIRNAPIIRM